MAPMYLPGRAVQVALVLLPVVVPTVYFYTFSRFVSSKTRSATGRRGSGEPTPVGEALSEPVSLPKELEDRAQWELAYERIVSHPVPVLSLAFPVTGVGESAADKPSALIRAYTCAAQIAFGSTPQAALMRAAIADPEIKRTFDGDWIRALSFTKGDLVNGAYRVAYHGRGQTTESERVEFVIQPPPSYKGHVPQGMIISEIQMVDRDQQQAHVIFVNETWMWRRPEERKTLIETRMGSWLHCLTVGWIVTKGVARVMKG